MNPLLIKGLIYFVALGGIFGSGWFAASAHYSKELQAIKQKAIDQAEQVAKIEQQATITTEEVKKSHEDNVANLRAYYGRLLNNANRGKVSGIPTPPARVDEVPADALPLAGECAETTEQLESLQKWIEEQRKISWRNQ